MSLRSMQCPSAEPLGPALLAIALAPALIAPLGTELTRKSAKSLHTIAAFVPSARLRRRLVSFLLTSLFLPFLLLSHARFLGSIMGRMGCKVVAGCGGDDVLVSCWHHPSHGASRVPGRKGRPQPREGRKGTGTGRAERRPGGGHARWGERPAPAGRLCPPASPQAGGTRRC